MITALENIRHHSRILSKDRWPYNRPWPLAISSP